jgi:hypothetical protein
MGLFSRPSITPEQVAEIAARAAEAAVTRALSEQNKGSTEALTQAIQSLFSKQIESFGKNVEAMGSFLQGIGELSVRRAAVALGSRGGRKRVENLERRKAAQQALFTDCEVCIDPRSKNSAAIVKHVNEGHEARRRQQSEDAQRAMREHQEFVAANGRPN